MGKFVKYLFFVVFCAAVSIAIAEALAATSPSTTYTINALKRTASTTAASTSLATIDCFTMSTKNELHASLLCTQFSKTHAKIEKVIADTIRDLMVQELSSLSPRKLFLQIGETLNALQTSLAITASKLKRLSPGTLIEPETGTGSEIKANTIIERYLSEHREALQLLELQNVTYSESDKVLLKSRSILGMPYPLCDDTNAEELFPYFNGKECGKFIHCDNTVAYVKDCPADLHWNDKAKCCDWQEVAGCNTCSN